MQSPNTDRPQRVTLAKPLFSVEDLQQAMKLDKSIKPLHAEIYCCGIERQTQGGTVSSGSRIESTLNPSTERTDLARMQVNSPKITVGCICLLIPFDCQSPTQRVKDGVGESLHSRFVLRRTATGTRSFPPACKSNAAKLHASNQAKCLKSKMNPAAQRMHWSCTKTAQPLKCAVHPRRDMQAQTALKR